MIKIDGLAKEIFPMNAYHSQIHLFFIKRGDLPRKSPVVSGGSLFHPLNHCFYKTHKLKETRTGCNKTDVKEVINSLNPSCDEVSNTVLVHLSMSHMLRFYCSNDATISPEYIKLKVYVDGLNYKVHIEIRVV